MNLSELLDDQVTQRPEQLAFIERELKTSYLDFQQRSLGMAQFFQESGIKAGDKVFIFIPMSIDLYSILFSLWRIGAVAMFADPGAGRKHIDACCKRVEPKAFIGTPKAQLLRILVPSLRKVPLSFSITPCLFTKTIYSNPLQSYPIHDCTPDSPALITFTSGSTGQPKAAVRTHGFLLIQRDILQKNLQLKSGSVDLATLPVFALINLACGLTTLIPNCDLSSPGDYNADDVIRQIEQFKPNSSVASPAFFNVLANACATSKTSLPSLRAIFTGGAPVYPSLMNKISQIAPNAKVIAVYGSTEAEPIAEFELKHLSKSFEEDMSNGKGLYAGPPVKDIQIKIIPNQHIYSLGPWTEDELKQQCLTTNKIGEIIVTGPHVLTGYLDAIGDRETKILVDQNIWHRTGDLGMIDDHGYLWLQGRASAAIQDQHGDLYPFAIETATLAFPEIKRAALCSYEEKRTLVIESDVTNIKHKLQSLCQQYHIEKVILMEIPLDRRHNAKVDYPTLYQKLAAKGQ